MIETITTGRNDLIKTSQIKSIVTPTSPKNKNFKKTPSQPLAVIIQVKWAADLLENCFAMIIFLVNCCFHTKSTGIAELAY